jgi:hypothetical protein
LHVIKFGQEAILYWCYFITLLLVELRKKTATSMVYQEIKQLLPEITDVNLHQKFLRAKKLYKLFKIEKIKQVSYSADVSATNKYMIGKFRKIQKIRKDSGNRHDRSHVSVM